MKVMKTENKSSMIMALLMAIFGALVTAILYFIIAKLGFFSAWAGAIGLTISISCYCFYTEKPDYMGLILCIVLNILGIILGEILYSQFEIARLYNISVIEVIRDFDLVEEMLEEIAFWRYPTIGAILVIISGFIIGKPILRAKNKKTENELMN